MSFGSNVVEYIEYDNICAFFLELKEDEDFIVSLDD